MTRLASLRTAEDIRGRSRTVAICSGDRYSPKLDMAAKIGLPRG
jgi:hypothetical protein